MQSVGDLRKSAPSGDTFKVLTSLSDKTKSVPIPLELIVNGTSSSDPTGFAEECARHFFPNDLPSASAPSNV